MSTTDLNDATQMARPQSLSASSLLQRAAVGFIVLFVGISASVLLYDASISPQTSQPVAKIIAPATIADNR